MGINQQLFGYIAACPTAFHTVEHTADMLEDAGYTRLSEAEPWTLRPGDGYYVTRNGSSLIAFRVPEEDFPCFMIAAAHGDAPTFKIKENAGITDKNYVRLSTEKYGGMLCATWLDRPLGIAGRAVVRTPNGLETRTVDLGHDQDGNAVPNAIIPSVAIHMNRAANENASYNPAVDMVPLAGTAADAGDLRERVALAADADPEDLLTCDLYLYNPQPGVEWDGLIAAPRLDDLQCAFSCVTAFIRSGEGDDRDGRAMPVLCLFDNEEVGSQTRQGAASTFLSDVLERAAAARGLTREEYLMRLASSFMLSCDNGHAVHPNHPEFADKNHGVTLGGGVVIKNNASQRYTSDAVTAGLFRLICDEADVPVQVYTNRADMPGGSTLGNISGTQVSVPTVDIGLAQLAMHASYETAGAADTAYMVQALTAFFRRSLTMSGDGCYALL